MDGEVVKAPGDVAAAVRRGIDYALTNERSYVLDIWTAQDTLVPPTTATVEAVAATGPQLASPIAAQPPLDFFHSVARGARPAAQHPDPVLNHRGKGGPSPRPARNQNHQPCLRRRSTPSFWSGRNSSAHDPPLPYLQAVPKRATWAYC